MCSPRHRPDGSPASSSRVDGCPVARNPATVATGLVTLGLPWLLGGYEYGGRIDQVMHGWIGDVRVVDRALPVGDFMIA